LKTGALTRAAPYAILGRMIVIGRSIVVFVRIMRGTDLLFELPVEIARPEHLSEGIRDAIELLRARRPDVSLWDDGITILLEKDTTGV
jgi:hypothetical protein